MGRSKANLEVEGTTLLGWQLRRLAPWFAQLMVAAGSSEPGQAFPLGVRVVYDLHPGAGPLAGIEAGLAGCTTGVLFALACDMPLVTARMAKFVIEASEGHQAAVPVIGGRPEPVCAAYRLEAAAGIAAALGRGIRRAAEALGELETRYLREEELAAQGHPAELFWNINTHADYQAFLARRHNLPG